MFKVIFFILIFNIFIISQVYAIPIDMPVVPNCSKVTARINEVKQSSLNLDILKEKKCDNYLVGSVSSLKSIPVILSLNSSKTLKAGDIINGEIESFGDERRSAYVIKNVVLEKRPIFVVDVIWVIENLIRKIRN